jgi:hypothetical protein
MGHGPCTFREADLTRALKAAKKAGVDVARCEIDKTGKIVLVLGKEGGNIEANEWDQWYEQKTSAKIR